MQQQAARITEADAAKYGLESVPSVLELYEQGLATAVEFTKKGEPTVFHLSDEGQQMIYDAQKRNAQRVKEYRNGKD